MATHRTKSGAGSDTAGRDDHTITIQLSSGERVSGPDLNVVLREIIHELMTSRGWTMAETARRLGLKQQTLHAYLHAEPGDAPRGFTVASLSRLLIAQKTDVVRFFRRHPTFGGRAPSGKRDDEERLAALLSPQQRRYLARALEVLADREILDAWIESQATAILGPEDRPSPRSRGRKRSEKRGDSASGH